MQIGEELLRWKQKTLQLYKCYERWIVALIKFITLGIGVTAINTNVGAAGILTNFYVIIGLALVGMFLPSHYIVMGFMVVLTIHLFSINIIIGAISLIVCLCTYILVIRFYPKESILIIAMMLAYAVNGEYVLPMMVSLFGGLGCIVPLVTGVLLFNIWNLVGVMLKSGVLAMGIVEVIEYILNNMLKSITTNREMFATMIIITIVYFTIYIIRKQSIDYAPYLAIAVGGVMNILGCVLAVLFLDIQVDVLVMVIVTILSIIICVISEYIVRPTDYGRAEVVQFEDEDNYYYVKVVPKISKVSEKTHIEEVYTGENDIEAQ